MFNNWQQLIPEDFSDNSRTWVYQSSRLFTLSEALQIEQMLLDFANQWISHKESVKGYANLLFGQFIILMADDSVNVSGCSIDSSVRLIKDIEKKFNVSMFERTTLAFVVKEKVELIPINQFNYAINNGFITTDTPYFNNTILTKKELLKNWMIPLKDSWLASRLQQVPCIPPREKN